MKGERKLDRKEGRKAERKKTKEERKQRGISERGKERIIVISTLWYLSINLFLLIIYLSWCINIYIIYEIKGILHNYNGLLDIIQFQNICS